MPDTIQTIIDAYRAKQPRRAMGGLHALSGFRFQLMTHLSDFVSQAIDCGTPTENDGLFEFLSDFSTHAENGLLLIQCKIRLTRKALRQAANEFVQIEAFRLSTFANAQLPPPKFGVVFRSSDIDPIPPWADIHPFSENQNLKEVWNDLLAANRVTTPKCEAAPELRLISKLNMVTSKPHAVLAELLEIVLSRGDGVPADNVRMQLGKCIEKAKSSGSFIKCRYLHADDFTPLQETRKIRVGQSPTISQLRRSELFRRTRIVNAIVKDLSLKSADDEVLSIYWISGRSGSGKSAVLLQIMEQLCNTGEIVAWLPEGATALYDALYNWPDGEPDPGCPRLLFVDDLYSPNVRDRIGLDSLQSLLMADTGKKWPLLVSCGPPEFVSALRRDFSSKPLHIAEWKLPMVDSSERDEFISWYEAVTGKQPKRGRAAEQHEGLIISIAHELEQGNLNEFANRFANRLRASNLAAPMCVSLAVNRLYINSPKSWLTTDEYIWLEELNRLGDFTLELLGEGNEASLRLSHPYISDAIYRQLRYPYTPTACAQDLVHAYEKAFTQTQDGDYRVARRILAAVATGQERINDADTTTLYEGFASVWRKYGQSACLGKPYAAADFWVSWCQWNARIQNSDVTRHLGGDSIEEAIHAIEDAEEIQHALLARLLECYPRHPLLISFAITFLRSIEHWKDSGWGFIWQMVISVERESADNRQFKRLVQLGVDWLASNFGSKSWPRVAQEILNSGVLTDKESRHRAIGAIDNWLLENSASRSWNFVYSCRLDFENARRSSAGESKAVNLGLSWLENNWEHPDWNFVWQALWRNKSESNKAKLADLAFQWLSFAVDDQGWSYVLESLNAEPDQHRLVLEQLIPTIEHWLEPHFDSSSWVNVWHVYFTLVSGLSDTNAAKALATAITWLENHGNASDWPYTFLTVQSCSGRVEAINSNLSELGADWLANTSLCEESSYVLRGVLAIGIQSLSQNGIRCVRDATIEWLSKTEFRKTRQWPSVFGLACREFPDEALLPILGTSWLDQQNVSPRWNVVISAILKCSSAEGVLEDLAKRLESRIAKSSATLIDLRLLRSVCNKTRLSVPKLCELVEQRVSRIRDLSKCIESRSPVILKAHVVDRIVRKGKRFLLLDIGVPALLDIERETTASSTAIPSQLEVSPISVQRKFGIVWVSIEQVKANKQRGKFIDRIRVGDVVSGEVSCVGANYIFAVVENQSIYVPSHEIGWQHPPVEGRDRFEIGDSVKLRITQIDLSKARVVASVRKVGSHPLHDGSVQVGMTFVGTVWQFKSFGSFVMLPFGLMGLLHVSRLFSRRVGRFYPSVKKVLKLGQLLEVRIEAIDREHERIELSLTKGPLEV